MVILWLNNNDERTAVIQAKILPQITVVILSLNKGNERTAIIWDKFGADDRGYSKAK